MSNMWGKIVDSLTLGVIAICIILLVRPGGAINNELREWLRARELRQILQAQWEQLRAIESTFGGDDVPRIVEFGDYECPFCRMFHDTLKALLVEYPDLSIAYRHYPLAIHKVAEPAARASICAEPEDRFEAIHDYLLENETWLQDANWMNAARYAGVEDLDGFARCLTANATTERIAQDRATASALGINRTPTLIVDGIAIVPGVVTLSELRRLLGNTNQ